MSSILLLLATASFTSTTACLPKKVTVVSSETVPGSSVSPAESLYQEARVAQGSNDWLTAKARYKQIIDQYKDAPRRADALAELGAILFRENGCDAGLAYYEALIGNFSEHPHVPQAQKSLAQCESTNAGRTFDATDDPAERLKIAQAAAEKAIKVSDFSGAVKWLTTALSSTEDPTQQAALKAQVVEIIDSKVSAQEVRSLLEEFDHDDFPVNILSYKLGRILYHVHDFSNAKEVLEKSIQTWPESPFHAGAKRLLKRITVRGQVNPTTIGVLLPLTGRLRAYGNYVRQAVQLAVGEFEKKSGDKPPVINVVFRDSKGDRIESAKAMEDFVLVDGAIAVIGGLFRVESEAAAYKAQELGVPFLSLSSIQGITDVGPYVFRSGLTNEAQIRGLVDYAMDVLGLRKFAVLYPRHPYGETFIHLFWDRVIEKGGEIRGAESYASKDTTFTWPVKRLVGRARLNIRRDFKDAIKECDKQPDPYRVQRCKRRVKSDLPPLIDFDGLFIPDYPKTLSLIAPALASEDVIVEQNRRRLKKIEKTLGRKVKPITLLGTNGWNSANLTKKAERYVENAIFPDGFFAEANDKATMKLVADFRKNFQRTPMLQDALFYDAMSIIKQVVMKSRPSSRNEMREALRRVDGFKGATGVTSFRQGQDAQKTIHILKIKNSKIIEAPPAVENAPTTSDSSRNSSEG